MFLFFYIVYNSRIQNIHLSVYYSQTHIQTFKQLTRRATTMAMAPEKVKARLPAPLINRAKATALAAAEAKMPPVATPAARATPAAQPAPAAPAAPRLRPCQCQHQQHRRREQRQNQHLAGYRRTPPHAPRHKTEQQAKDTSTTLSRKGASWHRPSGRRRPPDRRFSKCNSSTTWNFTSSRCNTSRASNWEVTWWSPRRMILRCSKGILIQSYQSMCEKLLATEILKN